MRKIGDAWYLQGLATFGVDCERKTKSILQNIFENQICNGFTIKLIRRAQVNSMLKISILIYL